jgi:hypothetical protein
VTNVAIIDVKPVLENTDSKRLDSIPKGIGELPFRLSNSNRKIRKHNGRYQEVLELIAPDLMARGLSLAESLRGRDGKNLVAWCRDTKERSLDEIKAIWDRYKVLYPQMFTGAHPIADFCYKWRGCLSNSNGNGNGHNKIPANAMRLAVARATMHECPELLTEADRALLAGDDGLGDL